MVLRQRRAARLAPSDRADSISRNTAFAFAMRIVGALFTGGLTLFLVRYLGPDDYGAYALALGVGGMLLLPADFGVSRSAARFIAERRGDTSEVAAVLRHALRLKLIGAGLVAVLLFVIAEPIARAYDTPALEWPVRLMGLAVAGQSLMMLFTTSFEALGRNVLGFRLAFSESAIEVSTSVTLVLAGAGVTGAVAGRAVGYGVAAVLGLLIALRALQRRNLRGPARAGLEVRRIAVYAGALLVIDTAYIAFGYVDTILIGAFLDTAAAGRYSAPYQLLIFAEYLGLALAAGVGPRLVRGGGREPNVDALQRALRLVLAAQFVLLAPIVVWATPITSVLFGDGYGESAEVLRWLGPFVVMVGPGPLLALGVNYLGEARRRVPLAVGALGINAVLDALLIPRIGIIAGAIATDVAFFVFLVGHVVICRQLIGLRLLPLARTLARGLLGAAAMAAVLFAFGTSALTPLEALAGAVLSLTAYLAILLISRELTAAELRLARDTVARVLAPLRPFGSRR